MKDYTIIWEFSGQKSSNPLEAAKEAQRNIENGDALQFTVIDEESNENFSVDLNDNEGEEVVSLPKETLFHTSNLVNALALAVETQRASDREKGIYADSILVTEWLAAIQQINKGQIKFHSNDI